jgi:hypothetical protein
MKHTFQNRKEKQKKRKEKAFRSGRERWECKAFWKNTTRRVEIFSKNRRAWPCHSRIDLPTFAFLFGFIGVQKNIVHKATLIKKRALQQPFI